jgi:hypothetical protein
LFDCGLGGGDDGVFLAPTRGAKKKDRSFAELVYNEKVRYARNIIEHRFARVKNTYPIIHNYPFKKQGPLMEIIICCLCLTNIDMEIDNPMRRAPCVKPNCPFCS